MKRKFLLLSLLTSFSALVNAQVKTTVQDGLFLNPFVWDCSCLPADGDSLVINHDVQMNSSIAYTSGQITINNGASLVEDGTDRDIWINGGSLVNHGTLEARDIWLNSGFVTNTGSIGPLDSLWSQAVFNNSGSIVMYDVLTDQTGIFTNSGSFDVTNNFNNQGEFLNTGTVSIDNDFSNCNTQSMDAVFTNDATFCLTNDFSNCAGDSLRGSGIYAIGGSSANLGVFDGTFEFRTPSGTLGVEGDVQPGVTVTTGTCPLGINENNELSFEMFPNPTSSELNVSLNNFKYEVYNYSGAIVMKGKSQNGQIDVSNLDKGIYWLNITSNEGMRSAKKFVKL